MGNAEKLTRWIQICSDLDMLDRLESDAHPHCPEEHAEWLHCAPMGPTEFEALNFLFASVLLYKPNNILETGTENGFSAVALASAVDFNGFGHVTTVDNSQRTTAFYLAGRYGLDVHISYVQSDSMAFVEAYDGDPFDFVFFDSSIHVRHLEVNKLWERKKVRKLIAFHDTSRLRYVAMNRGTGDDFSSEYIAGMDEFAASTCLNGLESHYGRGFRIMEIR